MRRLMPIFVLLVVLAPALALAVPVTINGTIQGYNCVSQGRTCPIGQEDPLAATESLFVVLTPDNKYYFVPNVDRAVMARHINEPVKISGDLNPQYSSIRATKIEMQQPSGRWRTVWTQQQQDIFSDPGIGPYPFRQAD
jgi:hypothetical protein